MKKAISRLIRISIGVASALLVTVAVQGSATASARDTYSAKHGSDSATVWIASETIYVNDRENDGNDVVGQVRWWDSNKAQIRIHNVWDRNPDGDAVTGNSPGPVRGIRVCEETGSCSAWDG
ncbi:hypothetical protein [Nonomuraea diastatica]|uniref:Uncharacterized protein n=1 Tax=Nonomuraea diastatica TaxID=1848329 RepID=A0A4R4X1I0_9ACTN|nr:hypothetical protein [Nonomuraea diastatica]TDD24048.1 hypothetical protein E1294_07320 [Nonomuraea diastatica]